MKQVVLEEDRQSKSSFDRLENELIRSRRLEIELIAAEKTILRLEADNLGLRNTHASKKDPADSELNTLRTRLESLSK